MSHYYEQREAHEKTLRQRLEELAKTSPIPQGREDSPLLRYPLVNLIEEIRSGMSDIRDELEGVKRMLKEMKNANK